MCVDRTQLKDDSPAPLRRGFLLRCSELLPKDVSIEGEPSADAGFFHVRQQGAQLIKNNMIVTRHQRHRAAVRTPDNRYQEPN